MADERYSLDLDGPKLRLQRTLLLQLAESAGLGLPHRFRAGDEDLLEGLVALTDEIADQAHDLYGIDCLLE